jgi:hypothetical protein
VLRRAAWCGGPLQRKPTVAHGRNSPTSVPKHLMLTIVLCVSMRLLCSAWRAGGVLSRLRGGGFENRGRKRAKIGTAGQTGFWGLIELNRLAWGSSARRYKPPVQVTPLTAQRCTRSLTCRNHRKSEKTDD